MNAGTVEQSALLTSGQTGQPLEQLLPPGYYASQLVSYLSGGDLNNARFLWKRLKNADEETAAVWRIGQALWNRQYGEAHKAIHGFQWSAALAPQITSLEATLRARTAGLLAKAYTGISVSDTADHLGLDEQSTVVYTHSLGWTLDTGSNILRPKAPVVAKDQSVQLAHLNSLADFAMHLEQRL